MNRLLLGLLLAGLFYLIPLEAFSQKKGGGPPPWAPAHGYRAKTRHIYFPEHNFYYDVQQGVYIYIDGGNWRIGAKLPSLFGNINLSASSKVELELNTSQPQAYNADHKVKYKANDGPGGKKGKGKDKEKGQGHGKGKHKHD